MGTCPPLNVDFVTFFALPLPSAMLVPIHSVGNMACGTVAGLARLWYHTPQLSLAGRSQLLNLCIDFFFRYVREARVFVASTSVIEFEAVLKR